MERNVFSFNLAIASGHQPRLYSYDPVKIPSGDFEARLDFKIWSKRILAINCYFTKINTEEKFVVTVYCNHQTARFQLNNSDVNFSSCLVGQVYQLTVTKSDRGKVVFGNAVTASLVE